MPQSWKCDFCSTPDPPWLYRAHSIEFKEIDAKSESGWAACETCHDLIEQNNLPAVAERAADIMCRRHPEYDRQETLQDVAYVHARFFNHRIDAPPVRLPKPANAE